MCGGCVAGGDQTTEARSPELFAQRRRTDRRSQPVERSPEVIQGQRELPGSCNQRESGTTPRCSVQSVRPNCGG